MKDARLQRLSHFSQTFRRDLEQLASDVEQISTQIDEMERSLLEIEQIVAAEQAHEIAGSRDAREQLQVGDTRKLVIEKAPGEEGPDAVSRIDGIVTFVTPQSEQVSPGDTVRVKITNVGENHANAVALETLT